MQMTAELLEQTVRALKVEKAKGTEQRRHPRVGIRCRMEITPVGEGTSGKPVAVWSKDVSEGGIALISPVCLKKGNEFIIRLPRSKGGPTNLLCTVMMCTAVAENVWNVGAKFERMMEPDEPAAAIDPSQARANESEVDRVRKAMLG